METSGNGFKTNITVITVALLAMVAAGVQGLVQQTLVILTITLTIPPLAFCVGVAGTTARLTSALRIATATSPRAGTTAAVAAPPDRATDPLNH